MHSDIEDKQALYELMCRYCISVDRRDFEHLRSLYHPDANHDHGDMFCGDVEKFITFLRINMQQMTTQHVIGNHLYHIDGDQAVGEIYTVNYHIFHRPEGDIEYVAGGRYIDHYQRNANSWLITTRKRIIDWSRQGAASGSSPQPAVGDNEGSLLLLSKLFESGGGKNN